MKYFCLILVGLSLFLGCNKNTEQFNTGTEISEVSLSIGRIDNQVVSLSINQDYCEDGITQQIVEGGSYVDDYYNRFGNRIYNSETDESATIATVAVGKISELQDDEDTSLRGTSRRYIEEISNEDFYLLLKFGFNQKVYSTFLINYTDRIEYFKDNNSNSNLRMEINGIEYCGQSGQIYTAYWEFSGFAYNQIDLLDSILLENVMVTIKNGY